MTRVMLSAWVAPMAAPDLAAWREARAAGQTPLPAPTGEDGYEAVNLVVDGVVVGGAILTYDVQGGRARASLRTVQTSLPADAHDAWAAALGALEGHARERGALTLVTAVDPGLLGHFQAAGFRATMTTVVKRLGPVPPAGLQGDDRVSVRPMSDDERRQFATDVTAFLRAGMERSGALAGTNADLGDLGRRAAGLAEDAGPDEVLLTALVEGEPVGRVWATLVTRADGAVDFLGNTVDLFPQFRGQGLTRAVVAAMSRHVRERGVREIRVRLYGHAHEARRTFLGIGFAIADVHLRKDLHRA